MGVSTKNQISVAAEAIAAAQLARCGFDVSVQYGANQPEYDLIVKKGDRMVPVSVKGSQDGSWMLTQSYKKNSTYHGAVDRWLRSHGSRTVVCLVQFEGVDIDKLPYVYLATPSEIGGHLKRERNGAGDTILWKEHEWKSGKGAGTTDRIPEEWRFTIQRVEELLSRLQAVAG